MRKLTFMPFGVIGGLLAGSLSRRVFNRLWRIASRDEAPQPGQRGVGYARLAAALALQGAVFRTVRGLVDHSSRVAFSKLTGGWPGDERAD